MKILIYNELNTSSVYKQFQKLCKSLENEDFKSAEIKKLTPTSYYRAKLDRENRLLFKFAKCNGETYILLLEVILHHDYEKSRFLNGAVIDENKIPLLAEASDVIEDDLVNLPFVNFKNNHFNLLDKIIMFDDTQDQVSKLSTPLIIIGSAGSGKTVLSLEKLKEFNGDVLYVTHSSFLVENSRKIYYSNFYINEKQNIDFLSFSELLQTIVVPEGREVNFNKFNRWFERRKKTFKISDAHKLYEEFRGVISGVNIKKAYLSLDDYLNLGVKQSIFLNEDRNVVYNIFLKYLGFLKEKKLYDINIIAYEYQKDLQPRYDYIVIDEIQDLTNIQIHLILKMLKTPNNFLLCGDSNQIVHPNFFSWAHLKTMFYENKIKSKTDIVRILHSNYRNSPEIIEMANRLLLIKNLRFGSIDKESNYLVKSVKNEGGKIEFLSDNKKNNQKLDQQTKLSTRYAVIVPRDEDKKNAAKYFKTPLLFSIHEAKGLEYDNIILYNFISNNSKDYQVIAEGIDVEDLEKNLSYSRGKDKTDKSSEVYKFYINSFYVAITRAVNNIYIIESQKNHILLNLLGLKSQQNNITVIKEESTFEEWLEEAQKLELQGKHEQAAQIRKKILGTQTVPWDIITSNLFDEIKVRAFDKNSYNKKAKALLCEYAALYGFSEVLRELVDSKYPRANNLKNVMNEIDIKYNQIYHNDFEKGLKNNIKQYGIDYRDLFNRTPLMGAIQVGNVDSIKKLLHLGADKNLIMSNGHNSFQEVLKHLFHNTNSKNKQFAEIYDLLKTPSIKIKIDNHLIKIDNHTMEYFLLNLIIAIFLDIVFNEKDPSDFKVGFTVGAFLEQFKDLPNAILPEFRKKRSYISSVLAKNEVDKQSPYNKKIFKRLFTGCYIINPHLEIMINDQFVNVYDMIIRKNINPEYLTMIENDLFLMLETVNDKEMPLDLGMIRNIRYNYYAIHGTGYSHEYLQSNKRAYKEATNQLSEYRKKIPEHIFNRIIMFESSDLF